MNDANTSEVNTTEADTSDADMSEASEDQPIGARKLSRVLKRLSEDTHYMTDGEFDCKKACKRQRKVSQLCLFVCAFK